MIQAAATTAMIHQVLSRSMPATTAIPVASTWKFSGSRWRFLSVPNTIPWSDRMNSHAYVRITNETKNGRSSINRKKFLRFARNAIQYETGNATARSINVAAPP